jgi:hypothetical protein
MAAQPHNAATTPGDDDPDLWRKAYQAIYVEMPKLVDAYQNLVLKEQAADGGAKDHGGENDDDAGMTTVDTAVIDVYLKLNKDQLSQFLSKKVDGAKSAQIRFKLRKDKELVVNVHDQVDRIVNGIICAKTFIGALASREPHAALAWAGVCVLLTVRETLQKSYQSSSLDLPTIRGLVVALHDCSSTGLGEKKPPRRSKDVECSGRARGLVEEAQE